MADPELVDKLANIKLLKSVPRAELEWLADHGNIERGVTLAPTARRRRQVSPDSRTGADARAP